MTNNELMTIHEVRSDLEKCLRLVEELNKEYIDTGNVDSYNLRSSFEYLQRLVTSKWTNETF